MIFNRKNNSRTLTSLMIFIVLLFVGSMAYASGGGGEHGGPDKMLDLLYRAICFTLMMIVLFIVFKKVPIKEFFANRIEEIKQNFENLNKEKDLSEKRYQELEQKLKDFEASRQEIIDQYKAEGAAEKDKIIAAAEQNAKQILAQAELTIQREIQAAGDRLKQEVMDNAALKAQEILAKEMKESDQDHLVDEFIKSVEKLH